MNASTPESGQDEMVHALPSASIVERIDWLVERCRGNRVVHIGFADAGFFEEQTRAGRWLHGHLADAAREIVGLDADEQGVYAARAAGFEADVVDVTDPAAVAALGIEPADVVVAGEVIEHLGAPGPFLDAMRPLLRPGGTLLVTTPNAYGLINVVGSITRRIEINHPDHVVMFTWRTLTELLRRHGWVVDETALYVPAVRERGSRSRSDALAAGAVARIERLLGRIGRPYSADGLIVSARPA